MKALKEMNTTTNLTLDELFQVCTLRLEKNYSYYLHDISALDLKNAMEYMLHNKGKCIRPMLIYATSQIFDTPWENCDIPACAIELIHTYSLIHDDLPCMDNADLRRNKPSCHKIYGEGIAILTGDALQSLAMQMIASHPAPLKPQRRLDMLTLLSKACGPFGMVAGQTLDLFMMNDKKISLDLLTNIYRLKTGTLFSACVELGRLSSNDDDEFHQQSLDRFGKNIGLAFQIQDDILDMETTTELLGKPQGNDAKNSKLTYPLLCGLDQAKEKVQSLYNDALDAINIFGHQAQLLRELTRYLLQRKQ
ncbi:MAG TPA: farnesyl diphosphate synthase [Gammaproteobacteria bacterium]|nr:farnesyl diphosphate synthase [Gammaproteobacteria bacterium]